MSDSIPLKRCTKCKLEKPASKEFFSVDTRYVCGLYPSCKKCRSDASNKYNKEHPEQRAEYDKEYRETHREKKREHDRKSKAKRRPFREQIMRDYWRQWRENNPIKVRAKMAKALAKRRNAEGEYTADDIMLQYKSQNGKCWWCGKKLRKYHIDHRIPVSREGTHYPGNIVISCPHCNLTKNNKMPWEWIGRLL